MTNKNEFKLSNRSLERLQGVDEVLIDIIKEGIKESPFDFGIPQDGGIRTSERQNFFFKKKVSKCDGYNKKSYHQTGKAFDIYAFVNGKASWDENYLTAIARHLQGIALAKGIKLFWGGDFKSFKDMPHFEIR